MHCVWDTSIECQGPVALAWESANVSFLQPDVEGIHLALLICEGARGLDGRGPVAPLRRLFNDAECTRHITSSLATPVSLGRSEFKDCYMYVCMKMHICMNKSM